MMKMGMHLRNRNILTSFCMLSVLAIYLGTVVGSPVDDDNFVLEYGNEANISGTWNELRNVHKRMNDSLLEDICNQAHTKSKKQPGEVVLTQYFTRKLSFHDSSKYQPIGIDVLFYLLGGEEDDGKPFLFYLTKGLKPDCLFYLKGADEAGVSLMLDEHVCGISMP